MTLAQWIDIYGTKDAVTPEDPEKCLAELRNAMTAKGIYFYGAGAVARTFLAIFERLHIPVKPGFSET